MISGLLKLNAMSNLARVDVPYSVQKVCFDWRLIFIIQLL